MSCGRAGILAERFEALERHGRAELERSQGQVLASLSLGRLRRDRLLTYLALAAAILAVAALALSLLR